MSNIPDFPEFVWIWNDGQGQGTPGLHLRMARWLAGCWQTKEREMILLAFRNAGKSTLVGLFCAWLLARDRNLRILVLAADSALARRMVRNVKRIIERHPFTLDLRPRRADQWAASRFTVERPGEFRDPSMLARGIGANITGSRADIVICDDVEVPRTCETTGKRADLRERLAEIDYVLTPGGRQLYIGTPHSYYSIYATGTRPEAGEEAPFLDGFARLELPLIDDQGVSLWPERFPPDQVEAIRRRTGPRKFASQMLLQPVALAGGRLDPDLLCPYDAGLRYTEGNRQPLLTIGDRRMVSASCWWDPSWGNPVTGDASVVAAVFTDQTGHYWLHGIRYLTNDEGADDGSDEASRMCRQVAIFARDLHLPAVTVETNGIGRFLPGLLRREAARLGVSCAVIEVASRRPKEQRILEAFDAPLAARVLHAHRSVLASPLITEMREWKPGTGGPDDGLDAVSGCLLSEPVRLPRTIRPAHRDWRPGGGIHKADTAFQV